MSRKKHPRKPSADELALWRKVVEKTTPLEGAVRAPGATPAPQKPIVTRPLPPVAPFRVGQKAQTSSTHHEDYLSHTAQIRAVAPKMDNKAFRQLKRGRMQPEARIDLHGMTLAQAQGTLTRFILSSQAAGHRLVLVITGKGRDRPDQGPIPTPKGILRHHVPQWLSAGILSPLVLEIVQAHQRHGGAGAYYVYLRRNA